MKSVLLFCFSLFSFTALQAQTFVKLDSSELPAFHQFCQAVLSAGCDSLVADTIAAVYQLKYYCNCGYTERYFVDADGHYDPHRLSYNAVFPEGDSLTHLFFCENNPQKPTDTIQIHGNQLDERFDIPQFNQQTYNSLLNRYPHLYVFLSAGNHEYLVVENTYILQVGDMTNWGTTETLFFERVR